MDKYMIESLKDRLTQTADVLYKDEADKGMAMMAPIIPDLASVVSQIEDADLQTRLMNDALTPALEAMESKDATALADIISYELLEILNEL